MHQKREHEEVVALIEDIARALVDRPNAVRIRAVAGAQVTMLEVAVGKGDVGQIVGRSGRTAEACRRLLSNIGGRLGHRFTLELLEPGESADGSFAASSRPSTMLDFEADPVRVTGELLARLLRQLVDHPDAIKVTTLAGTQAVVYEVHADLGDVRKLIGRRGSTAGAIRELLLNLGSRSARRFILELVEPIERVGGNVR